MNARLDNLRAGPIADVRSIDIEREDRDMCDRIRRSVGADDVLNEVQGEVTLAALDALLKADHPNPALVGGIFLAAKEDLVARLIARERGLS